MTTLTTDRVIIVGAGLGALYAALKLAPRPVLVISPETLGIGASSAWAQGGVAAAMSKTDSPEAHALDTMTAGAGTVDPAIARMVTAEAQAAADAGAVRVHVRLAGFHQHAADRRMAEGDVDHLTEQVFPGLEHAVLHQRQPFARSVRCISPKLSMSMLPALPMMLSRAISPGQSPCAAVILDRRHGDVDDPRIARRRERPQRQLGPGQGTPSVSIKAAKPSITCSPRAGSA